MLASDVFAQAVYLCCLAAEWYVTGWRAQRLLRRKSNYFRSYFPFLHLSPRDCLWHVLVRGCVLWGGQAARLGCSL